MSTDPIRPPRVPMGQALRDHLDRARRRQGRWYADPTHPDGRAFWCDLGTSMWGCPWCDRFEWPAGPPPGAR